MNKNRIEIIVLIVVLTFGVNYGIFTYYVQPKFQKLASAKAEFTDKQTKLNLMNSKKGQLNSLKVENEKLKKQAEELDALTQKKIDTPQLIYDFYQSCVKYKIKGEDMSFQLLNSVNPQNPAQGNQTQTSAPQTNTVPQANTQQGSSQTPAANDKGTGVNVAKLTITVRVSGEKKRIEDYIKNLYGITNRKLNVKSISLTPKEETKAPVVNPIQGSLSGFNFNMSGINTGQTNTGQTNTGQSNATGNVNIPAVNVAPVTIPNVNTPSKTQAQDNFTIVRAKDLQAEIVFNQYILVDGTNVAVVSNYQFNNVKIGFGSISDMFGTAKGK